MRHNRKTGNIRGAILPLISFVLIVSAFVGMSGYANAQGETVIAVEPSSQSVSFNETFTVNITIDPAEPITAVQCNLRFNSSLLTAISVSDGGMFDWWFGPIDINNTSGVIEGIIAFNTGSNTTSESGTFAVVTFQAKSLVGVSPIELENVGISNATGTAVDISILNATVSVGSIPVSIEPSSKLLPANTNFSLSITIDPLQPVSGAQCDITFDPSVITAVGVDDGGMFDLWFNGTLDINNTDGTIRNIVASNLGTTTSEKGTFAIIHFKTNDVSGTSPIGLLNVVVSDSLGSPLPIILGNGSIEVDAIPPALSYSLTGTAGNNNWYTSNVAVTLNATDEHGIAEMKYRIDDGVWQDYTTPFTISTDGPHTVQFYAIDTFGNNNSTSFNVNIDSTLPSLAYSLTGTAGSNNWYTSNVAVTLNATDENGIAEMKYRIDDGAWQDYTTPFTISTDGPHTVQFYAIDNAGNNNSTSFNVNIDREVPVLSHSLSGTAGSNNWYTSNVAVTLTATDASSGIDAIKYTINGGAEQEYTAPFTISSNGQYTIDFYAIDNAGNTAATSSFTIKIDSTSPVSSVSLSGTKEGNVYTTDVTVSISRTDSMSGIAYTKYRVNGGTWTTYTAPFTLSTDGTYTVDYYSADNAGNTESTKTATFEILKNHPPTADFSYTPANPTDTQTIHFTDNSDDTDGTIANYTWNFGDGNTSHLENPTHKYGDNGTYTVTLTVTDDKGATDTISKQIEVLNEPPTAYFKYEPTDNIKINDEVVFTDESTDKDGTIVNYTWNFGDGNVSYEKNPTHKYAKADTYTVTLTITDNDGATDSSSLDITVKKEQASSMLPILAIIILIIIAIAVVIIWRRRTGKQE